MSYERAPYVYECSGITISSEIELAAPRVPGIDPSDADVTVVLGEETVVPFERPSERVVAELIIGDYPWYSFCRVGDGYVCRMTAVADFDIAADLRHVVCHPLVDGRTSVLPIVIPGTITSFLLAMAGRCVLHGSAVDMGERALAFVGGSGQGKSTMAAVFCASGAALVADDVLSLEFESPDGVSGPVHCLRSGNEIRLREKSASLAERLGSQATVRMTADDRYAVAAARTERERLQLAAIVLPRPDRQDDNVSARLLPTGEASLRLARCQRIEGWRDREQLRRHFIDVGRIVNSVPVFEMSVPWGPPFADDLCSRALEACGLGHLSMEGQRARSSTHPG